MRSWVIGIVVLSALLFQALPHRAGSATAGEAAARSGKYRAVTFYVA